MAVPSPCTGVCSFEQTTGFCIGCTRTSDEIMAWGEADDEERRRVWDVLAKRRMLLGLEVHRLPWTAEDIRDFIGATPIADGGAWVSGIRGALAEFRIDAGETADVKVDGMTVQACTARGAISLTVSEDARALGFQMSLDAAATGFVVLAVKRNLKHKGADRGMTRVGLDTEAIRRGGQAEWLYDFGLGSVAGRFGIRTAVPDLIGVLDGCVGQEWPVFLGTIGHGALHAATTRVMRTPLGRTEIFPVLTPPSGGTCSGPNTRFQPEHLSSEANAFKMGTIPDSYVPCAVHYPA